MMATAVSHKLYTFIHRNVQSINHIFVAVVYKKVTAVAILAEHSKYRCRPVLRCTLMRDIYENIFSNCAFAGIRTEFAFPTAIARVSLSEEIKAHAAMERTGLWRTYVG
jgi:hypothetical protein